MPRTAGARNRDHDETRGRLASAMAARLRSRPDSVPALADLAAGAGVSAPTLRHYFGDLDGALDAALEATGAAAAGHLDAMADPGGLPLAESVHRALLGTVRAWREHGVGDVVAAGLGVGLARPGVRARYLAAVLDPVVDAVGRRLDAHRRRGEPVPADTRAAALGLMAPVLLALLHQDHLGGGASRPLDVDALAEVHAATMLAGWQALAP